MTESVCRRTLGLLFALTIVAVAFLVEVDDPESSESSGILDAFVFLWLSGNRTGADDGRDSKCFPDRMEAAECGEVTALGGLYCAVGGAARYE